MIFKKQMKARKPIKETHAKSTWVCFATNNCIHKEKRNNTQEVSTTKSKGHYPHVIGHIKNVIAKAFKQSHLTRSIYCAYYNYRKDLHGPFLPDLQYNITSLTIQDVCEEEMISKMLILPHK